MTSGTEALKLWMAKLMDFIQHCKYIYYTHTHTHTHTHTYGGRTYEGKCYFVKFIWFVYSDIWSFIQNNWDQTYFRLRIFQSLERSVSFWWLLGWMELKLLSPVSRIKCGTGRGGSGVVQFSSVAQSCPTLCDPMNRSTPGLPVHHQLPEFTQTHVQSCYLSLNQG